ncbi:MAG: hypothetical protein IPN57_00090 [Ignavibacteria bacterium]|nr:hypothetical protein [Ignavibacteria bacterium]
MWEDILKFLTENKSSLFTNFIAGLVFFVLGPVVLGLSNRKFRKEKLNRAKDSFLDLFENMLVNKETVSKEKLSTLFHAVSRQHSVNMEVDTDLQYLLEDLSLRFATSKHLSPVQKDEYSNRIEEIQKLLEGKPEQEERRIPKSFTRIFEELDSKVEIGNKDEIVKQVDELKSKLMDDGHSRTLGFYTHIYRRIKEKPLQYFFISIFQYYCMFI